MLDGQAVVGADGGQAERLFDGCVKLGARDLGPALAAGLDVGATTVSATVTLAEAAGIEVFATGGIGGVHRGADRSGDVSHDLDAMARHRVVVVRSAGVKAFLDVSLTFERLETLGVAILGWRTDRFPAFYVRDGGPELTSIVHDGHEVAAAFRIAAWGSRAPGRDAGGQPSSCPSRELDRWVPESRRRLLTPRPRLAATKWLVAR